MLACPTIARVASTLALSLLAGAPLCAQATWFVDVNAVPPGNGSQTTPYASIQFAIAATTTLSGDVILVAQGTYFENVDFLGKNIAVKSGQGATTTIIDGGSVDSCVVFANGEGQSATLTGFTLTHGASHFDPNASNDGGGGVFCYAASPTIRQCVIKSNNAPFGASGGGLYAEASALKLIDCRFDHNHGEVFGGGAFFLDSTASLITCSFDSSNNCEIAGGGACVTGGTASFRECRFFDNGTSDGNGGGLALLFTASVTIVDCTFEQNSSDLDHDGGGLYADASNAMILRSRFVNNSACKGGAAAWNTGQASFLDCTFSSNRALPSPNGVQSGLGGGLHNDQASVTAAQCLFEGNEARGEPFNEAAGAGAYGAALESCTLVSNRLTGYIGKFAEGSGATVASLHDCIVWFNTPTALSLGAATSATYCDVETPWAGAGNISVNPRFCDSASQNYRLLASSPCIDAGDPAGSLDPDGSRADMGAYAFDHNAPTAPATYCTAKLNSAGCMPKIALSGTPSATSGSPFEIRGDRVINQKVGFFFYGPQPAATPFQGGVLCVESPLRRTGAQSSGGNVGPNDCSGVFVFDFNAYLASGADPSLAACVSVYGQFWYRDPAASAGTGLTNAVAFTIHP